jgi:ABC-2 type transport system ATP-binding protein
MRIVLGVLEADRGEVRWQGQPVDARARRRFGYMPEERGLYPKMRVHEQLVYFARLHGLERSDAARRARETVELLGVAGGAKTRVETLSLGNQQRAQIAAALVHGPDVLILDEPFSGLDPLAVDIVAGVLQARAAQGAAVLFSSHQLDVVERLCDDLVIIANGRIRAAGSRAELREQHSTRRFELISASSAAWLSTEPGVQILDLDGGYAVFDVDTDETAQRVLRRAVAQGDVASFAPQHPTLAQIFKEVIQ